jgi:DNA-binding IclR family transcriptional regulator
MPGLQLTKAQLCRLCGLEEQTCDAVLDQLLSTHFLKRTPHDEYVLDARA